MQKFTSIELLEICKKAGDIFLHDDLPIGLDGLVQSPEEYVGTLSSTSGLPHVMVRRNMEKIHHALSHMSTILNG